ncbi:MAG: hypothetical protein B7Y36_02090 [Novosphingobium sp. 28-62-57]|uniref:hypothetical protein n=1 Tax=unclassified Novosphingobium TaxID=2644732 RepID=UPI000BCD4F34|nr:MULTISPECIES: hypothetical protein [unclassified Novosphingobium]OYW49698.1 MAG: hypothetical protein B7Z34_08520 [Novosphingobium sp. 12-62-10]OYZ12345.1 MAG: hypothetical protein B7Y36_02090 [Novosphingobium sp. 28-62-57]OZA33452.1 MAG: hypothetical protein B7X92_11400 [Novosphingobium sp. 17-62-9]
MALWRIDPAIKGYQASPRERAGSFVFALVASALVFLIMWKMGAVTGFGDGRSERLTAIDLTDAGQDEKQAAEKQLEKQQAKQAQEAAATPVQPATAPPPVPIPGKVEWPEGFIELSRNEYRAGDISKMKRQESASGASASTGSPGDSASAGQGPGGVRLYAAQWYREPTDAEIGPYLPARRTQGDWAMIACKTIEKYHVEDCQELGESPPGSGLARAIRQASWQFLVRPPRVNGKPQVGEWVRIRFDFRPKKAESSTPEES